MALVDTGIVVANSLTHQVEQLQRLSDAPLRFYTCGPTVYMEAHLGHARTYASLDTIRRILTDYFRIPVTWCMNITDVDDKIIDTFNKGETGFATAFEYSHDREGMFFRDMDHLNIRRPDSLLRVSEVIPHVLEFISALVSGGYAYEGSGSVYFDLNRYLANPDFAYCQLEPGAFNPDKLTQTEGCEVGQRVAADFALWKAAKEGEPSWASPWGNGRPGWHIECSTMAMLFFGEQFDVHCGGLDLRFPHHSNEIAQSQARTGRTPWVRTWLHTGQLNRGGEKMAKSTGNFTTVDAVLKTYTWREVRMAFQLVSWDGSMDLADGIFQQAKAALSRITNFLDFVAGILAAGEASDVHGYSDVDSAYAQLIATVQGTVRAAFSANFNVRGAIDGLLDLVTATYASPALPNKGLLVAAARYIHSIMSVLGFNLETVSLTAESAASLGPVASALASYRQEARRSVRQLFQDVRAIQAAFGVNSKSPRPDDEAAARQYDAVKVLSEHVQEVMGTLDDLRDVILPGVGIRLEDAPDGSVAFKIGSPEIVDGRRKPPPKTEPAPPKPKAEGQPKKPPPKPAAEVLHPSAHFRAQTAKFSAWDENGLPTKGADGQDLSKSQMNKVRKEYEVQLAKYRKAHPDT
jgi:cysteinyl-tRNA synthetase